MKFLMRWLDNTKPDFCNHTKSGLVESVTSEWKSTVGVLVVGILLCEVLIWVDSDWLLNACVMFTYVFFGILGIFAGTCAFRRLINWVRFGTW